MIASKQKQRALDNAYWKANKSPDGEGVNIVDVLWSYKTIWNNASDEEMDAMYNYLAERMGFGDDLLSKEEHILLVSNGWIRA